MFSLSRRLSRGERSQRTREENGTPEFRRVLTDDERRRQCSASADTKSTRRGPLLQSLLSLHPIRFDFVFFCPAKKNKKKFKIFKKPLERSRQKKSALFEASSHRTTTPNWRRIEAASIHGVLSRAVLLGRRREAKGKNAHQIGRRGRL